MTKYLFVYGTLLKGFNNDFADFLNKNSEFVGTAYFHGLLFEVDNYPGALYIPKIAHKVYGNLLKINHFEQVVQKLDEYEEIGVQFTEPHEYIRQIVPVYHDEQTVESWTYLYNHGLNDKTWIASGNYKCAIGQTDG